MVEFDPGHCRLLLGSSWNPDSDLRLKSSTGGVPKVFANVTPLCSTWIEISKLKARMAIRIGTESG